MLAVGAPETGSSRWRRTVVGLSVGIFGGGFGFSFVTPFLPIFFDRELGVHEPGRIAFYVGLAVGAGGLATALASPVWGVLADRFGRKAMVLRASGVAGTVTVLIAFCQTPLELLGARVAIGLGAGVTTASAGLIAGEAPASGVGWGLGILSSSLALGYAVGPPVGGLLATVLPIRVVFFLGGCVMLSSLLAVVLFAEENNRPLPGVRSQSLVAALRAADRDTVGAILALIACQFILQFAYYAALQLVVVRLIALRLPHPALLTGLIFGGVGVATGVSGFTYSRVLRRTGYRTLGAACAVLMGVSLAVVAVAPSVLVIAVATVAAGLVYGALYPSLNSMLGLEAPVGSKAGVFGLNGSAFSLGNALGALSSGVAAAAFGLSPIMLGVAVVALLPSIVLWRWAREPAV